MQNPATGLAPVEVHFEDMSRLTPEDMLEVFAWVLERVDLLSAWDTKQTSMRHTDTLMLSDDGQSLAPSAPWRAHLAEKAFEHGTTPDALMLEWVYGLVVPRREKAVDGSKRALGPGQRQDGVSMWSLLRAVWLCISEHLCNATTHGVHACGATAQACMRLPYHICWWCAGYSTE
jgi:hypothetical protein